ncbi:hypothetical protein SAMN04487893_102118 [Myroides guanonis]|uniref:Uncharacterized protein n=1 Tax=Myroides guanonis TaxID=1150112 RepID=A0A1I3MCG4_9FLAO|nr:hypothetical protein SAMN04487893_102118 [Myroides guanonis]
MPLFLLFYFLIIYFGGNQLIYFLLVCFFNFIKEVFILFFMLKFEFVKILQI